MRGSREEAQVNKYPRLAYVWNESDEIHDAGLVQVVKALDANGDRTQQPQKSHCCCNERQRGSRRFAALGYRNGERDQGSDDRNSDKVIEPE